MSEKFTEGDWTVAGEFMDGHIAIIVGDPSEPAYKWEFVGDAFYEADNEARGENGITREQALANAHLFAAAKEMFAVISKALEWAARPAVRRGELNAMYVGWESEFKAAFNKATGKDDIFEQVAEAPLIKVEGKCDVVDNWKV